MFIAFPFFSALGINFITDSCYDDYLLASYSRAWMLFLTVPLWVIELSPPRGRSILGGIVGLSGVVGYILAAYIRVGFFYYKSTDAGSWRAPIALGCFPAMGFLLYAYWLPESPRWLLAQDRYEEVWSTVRSLHATADDPNHEYATAEMYQWKRQHELDRSLSTSWKEMFSCPSYRKRAAIAFVLPWIMYSTGDLVITSKCTESRFTELRLFF
jgi:MFS family permease